MLRVGNLQRSIDFYTNVLGMQLLRQSENPDYKYSLAFLAFDGGNPGQAEIELTYNWGVESYDIGTAYGHIALGVPDAYAACDKIKAAGGGKVTRKHLPEAVLKRKITKAAPTLFHVMREVKHDPGYEHISEELRDKLDKLLSELDALMDAGKEQEKLLGEAAVA